MGPVESGCRMAVTMRHILAAAILATLSGCAVPMVCGPPSPDGYQRCEPAAYAPQQQRPVAYSHVPAHERGYAPAYPPLQLDRQPPDKWVADRPHWQPGDE
jgi:hypothetical protein